MSGAKHESEGHALVLYTAHERFWHWAQTAMILGLLWTGAVVRAPALAGPLSFEMAVNIHNMLAVALLANAALGLFFFITSGQIKHYAIEREGFVLGLIKQVMYYAYGIFRGATHPFSATEDRRLNLLQRLSYIGLLNVLLPIQIISGVAIYFASDFPVLAAAVGGLPVLVNIHAACAWMFFVFVVMHVYLTTTGSTPLEHIKTMVVGTHDAHDDDHGGER